VRVRTPGLLSTVPLQKKATIHVGDQSQGQGLDPDLHPKGEKIQVPEKIELLNLHVQITLPRNARDHIHLLKERKCD